MRKLSLYYIYDAFWKSEMAYLNLPIAMYPSPLDARRILLGLSKIAVENKFMYPSGSESW